MDRPLVLSLDGSTGVCSAALLAPGNEPDGEGAWEVVSSETAGDGRAQARVLLRMADRLLDDAGREPADVSAVVVGNGPGTFTGVRITVATARALALSLSIPVLGVSTLAGLAGAAAEARPEAALIVPIVDARRGQVFFAAYHRVPGPSAGTTRWERTLPFSVCDREALGEQVGRLARIAPLGEGPAPDSAVVVGEPGLLAVQPVRDGAPEGLCLLGLDMRAEWLIRSQAALREPGRFPEGDRLDMWLQGVVSTGGPNGWGSRGPVTAGEVGTPESVKPIYVRSPDADIHITKMRDPWASQSEGT